MILASSQANRTCQMERTRPKLSLSMGFVSARPQLTSTKTTGYSSLLSVFWSLLFHVFEDFFRSVLHQVNNLSRRQATLGLFRTMEPPKPHLFPEYIPNSVQASGDLLVSLRARRVDAD